MGDAIGNRFDAGVVVYDWDAGALEVFGYTPPRVEAALQLGAESVAVGGSIDLALEVVCSEKQELMIDYAVHHRKANGTLSPKVFKWATRSVGPGQWLELRKRHSMKPVTTRRYYPGEHRSEVLINGESFDTLGFELLPE